MSPPILPADVSFRTKLRPGDLGLIVHMQGVLYGREYGLDTTFEPYVARSLADFVLPGPETDAALAKGPGRIWLAEQAGRLVGVIGITGTTERGVAQLRWFLVAPEQRGTGLGSRLLGEALGFSRRERYSRVYLWTFDELTAARRLYERAGFAETTRATHHQWGRTITVVRMELDVSRV